MGAVVLALHAAGFALLCAVVGSGSGALAAGTGITAYTLGLRHAFDADHIAAIDNTTRRLLGQGRRPLSVGFWFSLGHSTIVLALALALGLGVRTLGGEVAHPGSTLHSLSSWLGTGVSGTFLYLIGALNLTVLLGIVRVLAEIRAGRCDEAAAEARLAQGGAMTRVFGRATRAISRPWHAYPVGALFGLGFDTASEVALLFLAAGAAGAGLPIGAVLCLPILFAAGMSLLDTLDGSLMTFAYGWALARPVRKIFFNLTITGLSVLLAFGIGTIELVGLAAQKLRASGPFWSWWEHVDMNTIGLGMVGVFALTWAVALTAWRVGRLEERWTGRS